MYSMTSKLSTLLNVKIINIIYFYFLQIVLQACIMKSNFSFKDHVLGFFFFFQWIISSAYPFFILILRSHRSITIINHLEE